MPRAPVSDDYITFQDVARLLKREKFPRLVLHAMLGKATANPEALQEARAKLYRIRNGDPSIHGQFCKAIAAAHNNLIDAAKAKSIIPHADYK